MNKSKKKENQYKILCEKVLNESWSEVSKHTLKIQKALDKKNPSEQDLIYIRIAARAFLQKAIIDKIDNIDLFDIDLYSERSPCGQNAKEYCPCDRDICLMKK